MPGFAQKDVRRPPGLRTAPSNEVREKLGVPHFDVKRANPQNSIACFYVKFKLPEIHLKNHTMDCVLGVPWDSD